MTDNLRIIFAPMLPVSLIEALALIAILLAAYALLKRAKGAIWRALTLTLLVLALANPSLIEESLEPLKDTVVVVKDESASMRLPDRTEQVDKALSSLNQKLAKLTDLTVDTVAIKGTSETDLFRTLDEKLSDIPADRLAGVIVLSDGEIHDAEGSSFPPHVPFHHLIAGHHSEIDRRIIIEEAPVYGIVGKRATLTLRVEDYPQPQSSTAEVTFQKGDGSEETFSIPVGKDIKFDVAVDHAGANLYAFKVAEVPGELTRINNNASVTINGIRDRLRVLLVSGEPHIGGRTWRNFLKSDPAVDLVHFTILRSPNKFDGTPNNELALIAFPVHELFDVKLKSFDLVIFDRFRRQSLIPDEYLENIANYVEHGGALLISSATDEAVPQLTFSPLARILPAEPTGNLLTGAFVPDLTETGKKHPVTATLADDTPRKNWGPWFRQIEAKAIKGDTVLSGLHNAPLLVLNRVGQGRVAQFLSDQFWLWARGYKGGGPQADLLKRTSHWLVGEPELDETALRAHAEATEDGWQLVISKQSLNDDSAGVKVTDPDGLVTELVLSNAQKPGILEARQNVTKTGLYRVSEEDKQKQEVVLMVGPNDAPEFGDMHATADKLASLVKSSGGSSIWLEDMPNGPDLRRTAKDSSQSGSDWIGLRANDQYRIKGSRAFALCPPWLAVIILLGISMLAWRREGA